MEDTEGSGEEPDRGTDRPPGRPGWSCRDRHRRHTHRTAARKRKGRHVQRESCCGPMSLWHLRDRALCAENRCCTGTQGARHSRQSHDWGRIGGSVIAPGGCPMGLQSEVAVPGAPRRRVSRRPRRYERARPCNQGGHTPFPPGCWSQHQPLPRTAASVGLSDRPTGDAKSAPPTHRGHRDARSLSRRRVTGSSSAILQEGQISASPASPKTSQALVGECVADSQGSLRREGVSVARGPVGSVGSQGRRPRAPRM